MIPTLDGVHHIKLPVANLDRSIDWYASRLGYSVVLEFREQGARTGVSMAHPDGGPGLGLVEDSAKARASVGFDFFSIGVPDRARLVELAEHLSALGETHAGVHFATLGWILPMLHDPDGHEVRFYSTESHTSLSPGSVLVVDDAIASTQAAEMVWLTEHGLPPVPHSSPHVPRKNRPGDTWRARPGRNPERRRRGARARPSAVSDAADSVLVRARNRRPTSRPKDRV